MPDAAAGAELRAAASAGPPELEKLGVPDELALRAAACSTRSRCSTSSRSPPTPGEPPTDVAPLYFVLSERFGIDAMLTRVTALPRDDRWDALARGALRDDLYAVLESLVRSVIDASTSGATAGGALRGVGQGQRRVA